MTELRATTTHDRAERLTDRVVGVVAASLAEQLPAGGGLPPAGQERLRERVHAVIAAEISPPLGGESREVTVLLSDLRGFSGIAERYAARDVVAMLNRYFARMSEIIYRHGGIVDKFMGDSVMALFGAPEKRGDDVMCAARCAVEMQLAMDALNAENDELGVPHMFMGIGINTGMVVAGRIGSELHSEYTVIGNDVNLTSRIEAHTLRGQILISESTYRKIADRIEAKEPVHVAVKGRREPVPLYELLGLEGPGSLRVPEREVRRSIRVDVNIPFRFERCKGQVVELETFEGRVLNLSTGGMFAVTSAPLERFTNIRFRIGIAVLGRETDDIYAKILRVRSARGTNEINLEFTSIQEEDRGAIKEFVERIIAGSFATR